MRLPILTFVLLLSLPFSFSYGGQTSAERPNILLILVDDLGYSDLGCYGGEIRTPNIDRLADGGIRFTQFYNTTRCCPSRALINTGLYPHQAGIGLMAGQSHRRGYEGFLTDRCVTLAEVLKNSGYRTYMSGKWHMGHPPTPIDRGFDEFFGLLGGFTSFFTPDVHNRLPKDRPLRMYENSEYYATDVFTDYALDFLADSRKPDENGHRPPFFLYLAYTAPHFPLHAPKEEIEKYADTYTKGWDALREERFHRQRKLGVIGENVPLTPRGFVPKNWVNVDTGWADQSNPAWDTIDADRRADLARRMAIFAAMVDRMDQNVGRVVDDLRKHGDLDNTLILFLSDNGACAEWDPWGFDVNSGPQNILHRGEALEMMGGPGTYHSTGSGWANLSNTPWRLYKHYTHEGGIRTPLIAHWPKGISRRGEFEKSVGHIIDFMPTFLELAGGEYPKQFAGKPILPMEGQSLVDVFQGKPQKNRELYWEHEGNRGVRNGEMKLVWLNSKSRWELYDLSTDPAELNDLADKHPEIVEKMAADWDAWAYRAFVFGDDKPRFNVDRTPGLKLKIDFSGTKEIGDSSGKNNPLSVRGNLPLVSGGRRFDGEAHVDVPHSDSLHCAQTAWAVRAVFVPDCEDGVVLACGGSTNGYSLALRAGKPVFTVVTGGKNVAIVAPETISGQTALTGSIDANGRATLFVDGKEVAAQNLPNLIERLPNESLQIGLDLESQVNEPKLPGFKGTLESICIYRGSLTN